jgi:hypothetical protein
VLHDPLPAPSIKAERPRERKEGVPLPCTNKHKPITFVFSSILLHFVTLNGEREREEGTSEKEITR